jgi:hypothetical protein
MELRSAQREAQQAETLQIRSEQAAQAVDKTDEASETAVNARHSTISNEKFPNSNDRKNSVKRPRKHQDQ